MTLVTNSTILRRMPSIAVAALLQARAGEELALNDRHLNPQLGRILRTLGIDRSWRGAEGAYLIDAAGDRYLDMLAGVLAEQLLLRAPKNLGHAVLTCTGTETVEAAIKLARGATGKPRILYC